MPQQELTPAENTPLATSYRVTPQEFAQAVSALESRRAAEEQQQAETIPIADAVQHLSLNTSEAEILSEVEAMRREQTRQKQQAAVAQAMKKFNRAAIASIVVACAFLSILVLLIHNMNLRHRLDLATRSFSPLPMQLLSQVPANIPVHVDDVSLKALASGTTTSDKVSVDTRRETLDKTGAASDAMFNNEWTLLKSANGLMVRVWATADQALRVSNNEAGSVFSNRPPWLPAANIVPVQLPAYRLASMSGTSFNAKGERGNGVNGIVQAVDLDSTNTTISGLVEKYLNNKQPGEGQPLYNGGYMNGNGVEIEDNGARVRLTGIVHYKTTQQLQTTLANEVLERVGIHASVVDELHFQPYQ